MGQSKFKPGDWVYKMDGMFAPYIGIVHSCDGEALRGTHLISPTPFPFGAGDVAELDHPKFYRLCTPAEIVHARLGLFPMVGSKHA